MTKNVTGEVPRILPDVLEELQKLYNVDEHLGAELRGGIYAFDGSIAASDDRIEILIPHYDVLQDKTQSASLMTKFRTLVGLESKCIQRVYRHHKTGVFKKSAVLVMHNSGAEVIPEQFVNRPSSQKTALFLSVLEGLADLHRAGLVHGSITPKSLMWFEETSQGQLRRLALPTGRPIAISEANRPYIVAGSETAQAPTTRDDLYALGMVGYQLFMGTAAFNRHFIGFDTPEDARLAWENRGTDAPAPETSQLNLDELEAEKLSLVLKRMIGRDDGLTYADAGQPFKALSTSTSTSTQRPAPKPTPKPGIPRIALLAPVALVALLALGWFFIYQPGRANAFASCDAFHQQAEEHRKNTDLSAVAPLTSIFESLEQVKQSPFGFETIRQLCETQAKLVLTADHESSFRENIAGLEGDIAVVQGFSAPPSDAEIDRFETHATALRIRLTQVRDGFETMDDPFTQYRDTYQTIIEDADLSGYAQDLLAVSQAAGTDRVDLLVGLTQSYDLDASDLVTALESLKLSIESAASVSELVSLDVQGKAHDKEVAQAIDQKHRSQLENKLTALKDEVAVLPQNGISDVSAEDLSIQRISQDLAVLQTDIAALEPVVLSSALVSRIAQWEGLSDRVNLSRAILDQASAKLVQALRARLTMLMEAQAEAASLIAKNHPIFETLQPLLNAAKSDIDGLVYGSADKNLLNAAQILKSIGIIVQEYETALQAIKKTDAALAQSALREASQAPARAGQTTAKESLGARAYSTATQQTKAALTRLREIEKHLLNPRPSRIGSTASERNAALNLCRNSPIVPRTAQTCTAFMAADVDRQTELTPFAMDHTEVSARQFARFVEETGYDPSLKPGWSVIANEPEGPTSLSDLGYQWDQPVGFGTTFMQTPDFPVLNISATDAAAYCAWAHPDGRLPSEAEWEFIARSSAAADFPLMEETRAMMDRLLQRPDASASGALDAVATAQKASPRGHRGMAGNAREWVTTPDGYALKGGSFRSTNIVELRTAARLIASGNTAGIDYGIRCAHNLNEWEN